MKPALEYRNFSVTIGEETILSDFNLSLVRGEITGLVGRSGAGKSMSALCAMGLQPQLAKLSGSILLAGKELIGATDKELSTLRGQMYAMVFQDPMSALNPLQTIEYQVAEALQIHSKKRLHEAKIEAGALLERVGLPAQTISPKRYPHQLSGGQRQRVAIAIAIANKPSVIFADEPTTALDITSQAAITELLKSLCTEHKIALLFITHDLAVLFDIADHIAVLRSGRIVAIAPPDKLPEDEKSALLGNSAPTQSASPKQNDKAINSVLSVRGFYSRFDKNDRISQPTDSKYHGLKDISFTLTAGETTGVVGESGSGKSTLARALLAIHPTDKGVVTLNGRILNFDQQADLKYLWQNMQIVFQDPNSSFNPRKRIGDIIIEPLHLLGNKHTTNYTDELVHQVLTEVGLDPKIKSRFPHALSGGQRQRVAIARALIIQPSIIVLDEATSALDVTTQNEILALLVEIQVRRGLCLMFISHDLSLVRQICERIIVLKDGVVVESGPSEKIMAAPENSYTKSMVEAALRLESAIRRTQGKSLIDAQ